MPVGFVATAAKEEINVPSVSTLYIIFILSSQTQSVLSGA